MVRMIFGVRPSTAVGPLLVESGVPLLSVLSHVATVRLLDRAVHKRTRIVNGVPRVPGKMYWSRRAKKLHNDLTQAGVTLNDADTRTGFARVRTLAALTTNRATHRYQAAGFSLTSGFSTQPLFDQPRSRGTRLLAALRMDGLWTARTALRIQGLLVNHPFNLRDCIHCNENIADVRTFAHLVIDCDHLANIRQADMLANAARSLVTALANDSPDTPLPPGGSHWDRLPAELRDEVIGHTRPTLRWFTLRRFLKAEVESLDLATIERLWAEAFESDWQGDLQALPWVDKDSPSLLLVASRGMLERLQAFRAIMSATTVQRLAVRRGWTDMFDYSKPELLALAAAQEGATDVLVDLFDVRRLVEPSCDLTEKAAQQAQLGVIELLHARLPNEQWRPRVGFHAAESGSLDLVIWLSQHHPECLVSSAISSAAWYNHMHIVRWIADNMGACNSHVLGYAAENGNLEMFNFLLERFPDILDDLDPGHSLVSANTDIIQWLDQNALVNPRKLVTHIIRRGEADALEWVLARFQVELREEDLEDAHKVKCNHLLKRMYARGVPFTNLSAQYAAQCCNVEMISRAIARGGHMTAMLIDATAAHGDPSLVEWWRVRHGVAFGQPELEAAIIGRNHKLAKYLLAMDSVDWDLDATRAAASRAAPRWLVIINEAIDAAAARRTAQTQ
ncbi:hypothetical protein HK105_203264 [Polyrhizophydium stewartii]|uniref:Uncharacterized protein n=1 Tax=Polyrhizophydium stewartii TaxID=2732419 RepID=A0ABR4NCC4_9FUNG